MTNQADNERAEPGDDGSAGEPDPVVVRQESTVVVRQEDEGPGWMPAILAGTLLLSIGGFVCCGISTWVLFQKRTELAIRTLRGSYVPALEQSLLDPQEKSEVLDLIGSFASDLERGKYENWQAAGVMQRLQRLPVLQWGQLAAIERFIEKSDSSAKEQALLQLSRLRQAVQMGKATSFDFDDVLQPVLELDQQSPSGRRLIQPLTPDGVKRVVDRAESAADHAQVPEERFIVTIGSLVRREIDAGISEGGF
jgi:hypothetical protein